MIYKVGEYTRDSLNTIFFTGILALLCSHFAWPGLALIFGLECASLVFRFPISLLIRRFLPKEKAVILEKIILAIAAAVILHQIILAGISGLLFFITVFSAAFLTTETINVIFSSSHREVAMKNLYGPYEISPTPPVPTQTVSPEAVPQQVVPLTQDSAQQGAPNLDRPNPSVDNSDALGDGLIWTPAVVDLSPGTRP